MFNILLKYIKTIPFFADLHSKGYFHMHIEKLEFLYTIDIVVRYINTIISISDVILADIIIF